jgi:Zn-dependent protease
MDLNTLIQKIAINAIPVLFAITVHEAAHGYVAMLLGDKTAYRLGRVTLNPLPHIDMIGTVVVPALAMLLGGFLFGWAKPVPIDPSKMRYPKKSFMWVALAGPASNMVMAIMWALVALGGRNQMGGDLISPGMLAMGVAGIQINMALMIFNLLPIPPLDGSRVVARFLKGKALDAWTRFEQYGMFVVMGIMLLVPSLLMLWFAPWQRVFSWIPGIAGLGV